MRRLVGLAIFLGVLGLGGWFSYGPATRYWAELHRTHYLESDVTRGRVVESRNSSGTVKPVREVQVGSFVSGPILEIFVDFNDEVKKGDILATIDPRIYEASVASDRALLATREADVLRLKANLQQAINDERRSKALRAERRDFISDSEMDQFKFSRMALQAQLDVAKASVNQARANLDNSLTNLSYTKILSPVEGIIIDRKIDPGQTVASQFQTPELFIVAPRMREEMRVFGSVDEADIGLIRDAQEAGSPVHFTVDAYPDDVFEGAIHQIRRNATTTQNVVTYPAVLSAPNPDLKLLPGMTANISFQVGLREDVPLIPNEALRFFPSPEQVRPEDRPLLEGTAAAPDHEDLEDDPTSVEEQAATSRLRNRRHVWIIDGDLLRAVEVYTGLSDGKNTELVAGDLREGQSLVIGVKASE